ncbi:preprotein translocase subunit SecG [Flavobacteriaceae bacterium]|jgi:preprotein translocase subunit SecG|nr:preprotein translocase subunit SecG [Flavobacteriaceae bacterium]
MGSFSIFLVLIVLVCFLLVVVIMVQNPKGGGLSSSFGGGGTQQVGGVKKTTDFLDKSTWALGIILVVLILASGFVNQNNDKSLESKALDNQEQIENNQDSSDDTQPLDFSKEE